MAKGLRFVAAAVLLASAAAAHAQYPTRPIRLLVPSAPGGGLDFVARVISPKLSEHLGQQIVVDNRTGASGAIALDLTMRAAPDGYTLMIFSAGQVGYVAVAKRSGFDLTRDFTPITQISQAPYVLAVSNTMTVKSLSELIAQAKANPAKINYASSGHATLQHLVTELFGLTVGAKFTHIPYKGVGAAFPDLVSGRTHMTISSAASLSGQIRAGTLRPLAVTSEQRMKTLPEVPTMIEAGIPKFVITQWHGLLTAARTPRPVVERIYREVAKAVKQPEVAQRLSADGTDPVGSAPQQFGAFVKSEFEKYSGVAKQTGITAD
jgi:tripartite-type tricarboxylate transporter receptor subunit TctC